MTRRDTLAGLLRAAGSRGVTTAEILQAGVGSRYGARLLELREAGWVVAVSREREGSHRYRLVSEPSVPAAGMEPVTAAAGTEELSLFDGSVGKPRPRGPYDLEAA